MGEYDKYFNKDLHKDLNKDSHIKHVIAVTSGKGGVGKSLIPVRVLAGIIPLSHP